ncbi:MAG: competence/damage-inducible protein A [Dehalococcoidia bacterium]|nr:competence/damage-inducible protein A [Dehalococcoidia bacterium]
MRSEILSIGTEIMLGEITDTNAAFIASQLPQYGIDLLYVTQVGDNPGRLREVFERAWGRSDIVFCSGGLGPTEDDITRETAAAALGEELRLDEEQERVLRGLMERADRRMPERNLKQAMLIPSARAIPNARGTAPGWWVERDGRVLVIMPGPPHEMLFMWQQHVAPELERRADGVLVSRTLKTANLGESTVDELLSPLLSGANPSIGIYARADGVHARIAAKAPTREQAWRLIRPVEEEARRILGPAVWGQDEDSLGGAIGRMLREQGLTLAVMESATGGAIAAAITEYEGASEYFKGSLVSYATQAKIDLGVPGAVIAAHGAVAQATTEAMAKVARERLGADIGLGLTGVMGPEPVNGEEPGTVFVAIADGTSVEHQRTRWYQGGREAARRRAVLSTLAMLRGYLMARAVRG